MAQQECGILSLPNELIEQVYAHLHPADVPNFAASCRLIFSAIEVRLPTHRSLTHKWRQFNTGTDLAEDYRCHLFDETPFHGYDRSYIHTLIMDDRLYYWPKEDPYSKGVMDVLHKFVRPCLANRHFEHRTRTFRRITSVDAMLGGYGVSALGVLLFLAPNIRRLVFVPAFDYLPLNTYVVDLIARLIYQPIGGRTRSFNPVLLNLQYLRISRWARSDLVPLSCLSLIAIFARLPSLVEVQASHFSDRVSSAINVSWTHLRTGSSNIQILTLEDMSFNLSEFTHCLRAIRSLRELNIATDAWMQSHGNLASAIFTALNMYHRHSLERLSLGMYQTVPLLPIQSFQSCVLRKFTRLKHVHMIHRLFRCTCPEFHAPSLPKDLEMNDDEHVYDRVDAATASESPEKLLLSEVLPESIQSIGIDKAYWFLRDLNVLGDELRSARREGAFLALCDIDIRNSDGFRDDEQEERLASEIGMMFRELGIALQWGARSGGPSTEESL